jgi:hypothetical protein
VGAGLMGAPDEYDWGITPEALEGLKADMSVSVSLELGRDQMERISLAIRELDEKGTE